MICVIFHVIRHLMKFGTWVFVESTMERSQNDRELMTQNEMRSKKEFLTKMQKIFEEVDDDHSGEIKLEELQEHMQDPHRSEGFTRTGYFIPGRDGAGAWTI